MLTLLIYSQLYFASVYFDSVLPVANVEPLLDSFDISDNDIRSAINNLKLSIDFGPDFLPSIILKNCISALLSSLLILFRQSVSFGILPGCWKHSYITSVFKSDNRQDIGNYRPISIGNSSKNTSCNKCCKDV